MKKLRLILTILFILPVCFLFSACGTTNNKYVVGFEKVSMTTTDIYLTVKYSDGSNDIISMPRTVEMESNVTLNDIKTYCDQNGYDFDTYFSENMSISIGNSAYISLSDIKTFCVEQGISLTDFFNLYCKVAITDDEKVANTALNSAVMIAARGSGVGSGFVYKMDEDYSYIVTCQHVVQGANGIFAYQFGYEHEYLTDYSNSFLTVSNRALYCQYVGGSESYDVAVLRVSTAGLKMNNPYVAPALIAQDYSLAETVYVVGNAEGEGISVTKGIVNVKNEDKIDENGNRIRQMRIDAAVNHGNSGCALFNADSEIIGLVNAKYQEVDIDNMAFAIPVDNFTKVADNIIYNFESLGLFGVYRASLGVTYTLQNGALENENGSLYRPSQPKIVASNEGTVAYNMGIRAGDILTGYIITRAETDEHGDNIVDSEEFKQYYEFGEIMLTLRIGDKIKFTYERTGVIGEQTTQEYTITTSNWILD